MKTLREISLSDETTAFHILAKSLKKFTQIKYISRS